MYTKRTRRTRQRWGGGGGGAGGEGGKGRGHRFVSHVRDVIPYLQPASMPIRAVTRALIWTPLDARADQTAISVTVFHHQVSEPSPPPPPPPHTHTRARKRAVGEQPNRLF